MEDYYEKKVEAIENGKIVKVLESYAKREGLPVIRKPAMTQLQERYNSPFFDKTIKEKKEKHLYPDKVEPSNWRKTQVTQELIDNFQWTIAKERKKRGLTRKQFALLLEEPEETVKSGAA